MANGVKRSVNAAVSTDSPANSVKIEVKLDFSFCHLSDDCASDADCGPDGKCIQDGLVPGQRSCFCQFGFFGVNCERSKSFVKLHLME